MKIEMQIWRHNKEITRLEMKDTFRIESNDMDSLLKVMLYALEKRWGKEIKITDDFFTILKIDQDHTAVLKEVK